GGQECGLLRTGIDISGHEHPRIHPSLHHLSTGGCCSARRSRRACCQRLAWSPRRENLMTPTDRPLSALVASDASLAQAWIDACRDDATLDEVVALEAASDFLLAMAAAIQETDQFAAMHYRYEECC